MYISAEWAKSSVTAVTSLCWSVILRVTVTYFWPTFYLYTRISQLCVSNNELFSGNLQGCKIKNKVMLCIRTGRSQTKFPPTFWKPLSRIALFSPLGATYDMSWGELLWHFVVDSLMKLRCQTAESHQTLHWFGRFFVFLWLQRAFFNNAEIFLFENGRGSS